ncbi:MAG TPA: SagB/ThcOx family dehydrogenase [Candidatus Bathyarchaeia archaeon]|nr:SagB/ThcOx family dehydrogenase [Candidatus Bathyarchaeia archaeon]
MHPKKSENGEIRHARNYHEATKHSEISVRTSAHYLDWENRPAPFKTYADLPKTPLPRKFSLPDTDAPASIGGNNPVLTATKFGIEELAELLFFTGGITRKLRVGGEFHYMRAASATGALYPIELYVVTGDLPGLEAGVYHFDPLNFSLSKIRSGDYRQTLASVSDESVLAAPATLVFTSLAWKNAWKYQARSYRHWYWDAGVMTANFLATSNAMSVRTKLVTGFIDDEVNLLIAMEKNKEATVALAPVAIGNRTIRENAPTTIQSLHPNVRPLSPGETEYPEIWRMHHASSLQNRDELVSWIRNKPKKPQPIRVVGQLFPLASSDQTDGRTLSQVILQRGSARRFAREPVTFSQLSLILKTSMTPMQVDYSDGRVLVDAYFIANLVAGIPSGSYVYRAEQDSVEQLQPTKEDSRRASAYLALEQPLFGDASIVFFLMADLEEFLWKLGNRGYRAAQLEGGIIGGRIYLSSYALGLGASGSTFYDDAVTEFFSPHAKGKSTMIVVAVGVPAYKAKSGRILPQFS